MNSFPADISGLCNRILDLIPDMLVLYDGNAAILDIRHPLPELMASDEAGRPLKEVSDALADRFRTVRRTKQPVHFVYPLKRQDGKENFYEVILSYLAKDRILADIRMIPDQPVARIESRDMHFFFNEVLDNIAIPITVKSMDTGRYLFWSKKAERFGRTSGEMVGSTEEFFMLPEQARVVGEIERQLAENSLKLYQGVEKYLLSDGCEHTFVVTRTPFTFGEERLSLNSALDISELQETQASLMHTKDELARKNMVLNSVLSLAMVIPWGCDLLTRTFYCDYDAYHPEKAKGPDEKGHYIIPMDRYFAGIHPDFRQDSIRMIDELIKGKREEFHETYLVHWFNNREWEWVRVQSSVSRRDSQGRPVQLIGSAQRVTEQKETELALRQAKEDISFKNVMLSSVLNIAQVIPWSGDLKAGIFSCDYSKYHHESAEAPDADGRYTITIDKYFEQIHPDYRPHAYDLYADLVAGEITGFHEVYPFHWLNDKEYEWVEILSSISKYDADGRPSQLIGSARVITEQKRMEESLRVAKEQAERSNTLKSAFLANMSHEIRTPLNAIVGFSELLAQSDDEQEKLEYLGIIQSSNAMLLQLIGDILDLSKIEAGTLEFSFADYDLDALLDEFEQTARMKVTDPAIEVACMERAAGCTIHTDRSRLLQVLYNFLNNAVKFTRCGHIHFGFRENPDGQWYFYVEDTGCGISPEKMDSVFERFVKLDGKAKGTGLGLAISKSIVERLGGEIGVHSSVGQGSTFWFLLPAGCITTSASEAVSAAASRPVCQSAVERTTILVAEDDPANYKLFEAMLRKHYRLLHAWNGREAVELFREHRPGMILMDIKMPEMDGYEATAAIRKLSEEVPIVAVTAFAYPEDMRRILSGGFNGCLPKPVSADKLKKKISELCRGREDLQ